MTNAETAVPVGFFHPTRPIYRFTNLLFIASLTFGSYFAYDIIGAIAPSLIEGLNAGRATVGAFNTMYSVAAILVAPLRRRAHRPAGDAQGQHHLLGPGLRRRGHRLAGQVHPPDVPRPVHLRGRLRAPGRRPERHAGPLVQEQGTGPVLRRRPDREPPRFPLRPQQRTSSSRSISAATATPCWRRSGPAPCRFVGNLFYIVMDKRGEKALNLRDESAGDKIVFKDIKEFKPTFWYVTFLCLTFYAAIFPFQSLSTDFFHTKWGIALTAPSPGGFLAQVFNNFLHIVQHGRRHHQHHHLRLDDPGPVRRAAGGPGREADDVHGRRGSCSSSPATWPWA